MSSDFAEMLKTTLNKMQERIDDANQTYEGDAAGMGHEGSAAFEWNSWTALSVNKTLKV